jgi:hypothetical protein
MLERKVARHLIVVNQNGYQSPNSRASFAAAAARWGANLIELVPPPSALHPAFVRNLTALSMFPDDRIAVIDGDCLIRYDAPDPFELMGHSDAVLFGVEDIVSDRWSEKEKARVREQVKARWGRRIAKDLGVDFDEEFFCSRFVNAGVMFRNPWLTERLVVDRFAEIVKLAPDLWGNAHYEQAALNWSIKEKLAPDDVLLMDERWNTITPTLGLPIIDCYIGHFTNLGDGVDRRKAIEEAKWHR